MVIQICTISESCVNVHTMQIMQELSTNKSNFPSKYTEDFNQTTHVAPYEPIVFNDNISFYLNSFSSVQDVLKESLMVMS